MVGGKQQEAAKTRKTIDCLHYNLVLVIPEDKAEAIIEHMEGMVKTNGGYLKVMGDAPVQFNCRECPKCGELIHWMANHCYHCKKII